jgi:hypothetical protein
MDEIEDCRILIREVLPLLGFISDKVNAQSCCTADPSRFQCMNNSLVKITLQSMDISGYIPKEIAHLKNLQLLVLENLSNITGNIPAELGQLKQLRYLY